MTSSKKNETSGKLFNNKNGEMPSLPSFLIPEEKQTDQTSATTSAKSKNISDAIKAPSFFSSESNSSSAAISKNSNKTENKENIALGAKQTKNNDRNAAKSSSLKNNRKNYNDYHKKSKEEFTFDPNNMVKMSDMRLKSYNDLAQLAKSMDIKFSRPSKEELILLLSLKYSEQGKTIYTEGIVDSISDGYAFIRSSSNGYSPSFDNIYIPQHQVKKFKLQTGDEVNCYVKEPRKNEKYFSLAHLIKINGKEPDYVRDTNFRDLTAIGPKEKLILDLQDPKKSDISTRVIDIVAPIGKGQRALIVAPPRTGKTVLMQDIAKCINKNHPESHLIVLLIDERPEEVTDMRRQVQGEIVSSTFDESPERHVALAEIIKAKAERMTEEGKDVIILLDSITRLARAYNTVAPSSGKVLSGGIDSNALQKPKRFFGMARNTEEAGSLTIIATALVETGSRMDEVIFEEFKGRGNCEIVLERKIAEKRVFPAINILRSGTRREDTMISPEILSKMSILRRIATHMNDQVCTPIESIEFLINELSKTDNNQDFFKKMNS